MNFNAVCEQKHSFTYSSEVYYHSLTKFYIQGFFFEKEKKNPNVLYIPKNKAAVSATPTILYTLYHRYRVLIIPFLNVYQKVDSIKKMICISKNLTFLLITK